MLTICCLLTVFCLVALSAATPESPADFQLPIFRPKDPEIGMSTTQMIKHFGYPVELHRLTTKDGFKIKFFRIPRGKHAYEGHRTPVLVQHGLFASSDDWVMNFPHQSLPFYLADRNYDVFIGNIRGNTYGRDHETLDPDTDEDFWKYSWDEFGLNEVPMMIDHVLNTTGYSQLYYVGHSMGCNMMLVCLSSLPKYNDKVKKFIAMAPAVYGTHTKSLLVRGLALLQTPAKLALQTLLPTGEFKIPDGVRKLLIPGCESILGEFVCSNLLFLATGFNPDELNATRWDVYLSHTPSGTSLQVLFHFAQAVRNHYKFETYDYRRDADVIVEKLEELDPFMMETSAKDYKNLPPREFKLENVRAPTVLMYGNNDLLATREDVHYLYEKLNETMPTKDIEIVKIGTDLYAHNDFVWGVHNDKLVNPHVVERLPHFDPK